MEQCYQVKPTPPAKLVGAGEVKNKPFYRRAEGANLYEIREYQAKHAATLVKQYIKKSDLCKLEKAISQDKIRDLRNDVAHNVPTEEKMKHAEQKMRDAKLWSCDEPSQFLCQDLVKNVLRELGITDPAQLCERLISDVEQRILVPS